MYQKHKFYADSPTIMVQTLATDTGWPEGLAEFEYNYSTESQYVFEFRIRDIDDYLLDHNIVLNQSDGVRIHLSDEQYAMVRSSNPNLEYEYLGRLCHLLMDMAVPSHAHNDAHGPTCVVASENPIYIFSVESDDCDYYEGWNALDHGVFHYDSGGHLEDLTFLDDILESDNIIAQFGREIIPLPSTYNETRFIYDLFFTVNQITQHFASEDVDGNLPIYTRYPQSDYPYIVDMQNQISALIAINPALADHAGVRNDSYNTMTTITNTCITLAIRAVATLLDWWQNRYDNEWEPWGQEIIVSGQINNTNINHSNTVVKIRRSSPDNQGEYVTTIPDASGNFELSVYSPSQSYYELWIENDICHPIYSIIDLPGHDFPNLVPIEYDAGSFSQVLIDETGLHVNGVNSNCSLAKIMVAVDYALDHNINRITLEPHEYYELIDIKPPLQQNGLAQNLEICGQDSDGSTILHHPNPSNPDPMIIVQQGPDGGSLGKITFKNLVVKGTPSENDILRGFIFLPDCADSVFIENCEIKDFEHTGIAYNEMDMDGIAVYSSVNTVIKDCNIHNNTGIYCYESHKSNGVIRLGADSVIANCEIYNNASGRGAIYIDNLYNDPDITIVGNEISSNRTLSTYGNGIGISCANAGNITIENNIFNNNGAMSNTTTSGSVIDLEYVTNSLVKNNSFINNSGINTANLSALKTTGNNIHALNNNIFSGYDKAIVMEVGQDINNVSIYNNLFNSNDDNFYGIEYDQEVNQGNCLFENPFLDEDFYPLWNTTVISPCIDAGIGDDDIDGTPPDIGAKKPIAHEYWDYSFTTQADLEKWYWVSYPVLNSVTNNALMASEFFGELLDVHDNEYGIPEPTYLEKIYWMVQGGLQSIYWNEGFWQNSSHFVSSPQGYKVKLFPRVPSIVTLRESGLRTPSNTQFTIYGENNGEVVENWLGYFRADSTWPHEVFASIWDDITMIRTKSWCLVRSDQDEDYWGMHGKVTTLNDGDMVIITTQNDHTNFQWNNANATPPETKELPEYFIFNEKQDYVPVYVSIPDSIKIDLKEIGLYLDGVCKGAVVIKDNVEQICAYLDIDEKLTDGVVEFVFYYNNDKSQYQEKKTVRMDPGRLCARYVNGNERYPYYDISITAQDMDDMVPPELTLGQNYPNPFNPSTTISYQLPATGKTRLDIYNVRGQLVRTLIDAEQEAGYHSVVWNGTDNAGQSVASGIYFYRLSSPAQTLGKRMLLMK